MDSCGTKSNITIGVLKLNTNFPRLTGDIGNPDSFNFPVRYITVESAVPANITVADKLPDSIQNEFIAATDALVETDVSIITTTCGFLSTMQQSLASRSKIPVICSALELLPLLVSIHGSAHRIGVLTFNKETLNEIHTSGVTPAAIEGLLPTDHLRKVISEDLVDIDEKTALENVTSACARLIASAPQTSAILLECTNLSPYKHTLKEQFRLPVYDVVDAVHWLLAAQTVMRA